MSGPTRSAPPASSTGLPGVFSPEAEGAVGDGTHDDFPAWQAAFNKAVAVAQAGGTGVVLCDPRHTYFFGSDGGYRGGGLSYPANLPGRVVLHGGVFARSLPGIGARIKFGATNYRFVDLRYHADFETFQNLTIDGFFFDYNNVTPLANEINHVVVGHYVNQAQGTKQLTGVAPDTARINFDSIAVLNCKGRNVPDAPGHQKWVWLQSIHDGPNEAVQSFQTNLLMDNCDFIGGNTGFQLGGGSYSSVWTGGNVIGINVWWDNIHCADCFWSANAPATVGGIGAGFQIGNRGFGGSAVLERCTARWSRDVNFEMDCLQSCVLTECVGIDAWSSNYTVNNYNGPGLGPYTDADRQIYRYDNCRSERTNAQPRNRGFSTGPGGDGTAGSPGQQIGTLIYDKCKGTYSGTTPLGAQSGNWCLQQHPKALRLINCQDAYVDWTLATTGTFNYATIQIPASGNPATSRCDIQIRGMRSIVRGVVSAGTPVLNVVKLAGCTFSLLIDGLGLVQAVTASGGYTIPGGMYKPIDLSGGTFAGGVIRRLMVISSTADDNAPKAINIPASTALPITAPVYVENCDFTNMLGGSPVEVSIGDTANKRMVFQARNAYKVVKQPAALTVAASPYDYENTDGYAEQVIVSGGTVSQIEQSTDGGATYTVLGVTAGVFVVGHTDHLRVTYTVAPTMKKVPLAR